MDSEITMTMAMVLAISSALCLFLKRKCLSVYENRKRINRELLKIKLGHSFLPRTLMQKGIFITLLIFLATVHPVLAQEKSPVILIQGSLSEADHKPVSNGSYSLRFELYDQNDKGRLLWSEVQNDVLVVDGVFNAKLGSTHPLDSSLLNMALFLEINPINERVEVKVSYNDQDSVTYLASSAPILMARAKPSGQIKGMHVNDHEDEINQESPKHAQHGDKLIITPGGYLESFYSYNFNRPSNNITALRGFDFIHNSFTIGNFVMSTDAKYKNFSARIALNVGLSPSQFYKQEPSTVPSYQIPSIDRNTWQLIQEAMIGWESVNIPGLIIQAGVMATPIGIEGLPNHQTWKGSMNSPHMHPKDYRENWHWSRSNAFINVPDYHSGLRVLYSPDEKHHFGAFLLNGQNMVTDNNDGKTLSLTYLWMPSPGFHISTLYMGGPERDRDAPEGQQWRHLFDTHLRWQINRNLTVMTQFTPGFEQTNFGKNWWTINALYASWEFDNAVRLAFRYESLLENKASGSSTVFLRSVDENNFGGLYGYTGTVSVPIVPDHLMVRLEYRHDYGTQHWFYKGELQESGKSNYPYTPNAKSQNTVTVGLVGWF